MVLRDHDEDAALRGMGGWMGGWMGVWMGGCVGGRGVSEGVCMDVWMGGWMDGWVDGWMGGWMDGWGGECVDGCEGGGHRVLLPHVSHRRGVELIVRRQPGRLDPPGLVEPVSE